MTLCTQADLFRAPHVPAPWPHATPLQVKQAHHARQLAPLPSKRENWKRGNIANIHFATQPLPIRDAEGVVVEQWRRCNPLIDREGNPAPISLGWSASSLGRVHYDGWPYQQPGRVVVTTHADGRRVACLGRQKMLVARLVAAAFLDTPERRPGLMVLHRDGNSTNDSPDNLYYGTGKDNFADAVRHGTRERKLEPADIRAILLAMLRGEPARETAARHGVAAVTVKRVQRGELHGDIAPHHWRRAQWNRHRRRFRDPHRAQLAALERIAWAIQADPAKRPIATATT